MFIRYRNTLYHFIRFFGKEMITTHDKQKTDEFSNINKEIKVCLAFFISEEECNFIRKNGCDKFEEFLEENNVDVMNINR